MLSVVALQVGATQIALRLLEIFVIALPLVGVFAQLVFRRVINNPRVEESVSLTAMTGLMVSSLSLIFASILVTAYLIYQGLPASLVTAAVLFIYGMVALGLIVISLGAVYEWPDETQDSFENRPYD